MTSTTETVRRAGGAPDLLVRHWAAAGRAWAAMLIVHGIAEHSGRYERTGDGLRRRRHRRHRASTCAATADRAAAGLRRALVATTSTTWSGGSRPSARPPADVPVVLLGHSLGGLIALDYVTSGRPGAGPAGPVLARPRIDDPRLEEGAGPGPVRASRPTMRIKNDAHRRPAEPPIRRSASATSPIRSSCARRRRGSAARPSAPRTASPAGSARSRIPTLVFHGGADTIVPVAASEPLAAIPGVRRIGLPGPPARDAQRAVRAGGRGRRRRLARASGSRRDARPGAARRRRPMPPARAGSRCRLGGQPKTASGERSRAESVAPATDPPNLIWLVPAKEAGPHRSDAVPSRGRRSIDAEVQVRVSSSRPRRVAALALVAGRPARRRRRRRLVRAAARSSARVRAAPRPRRPAAPSSAPPSLDLAHPDTVRFALDWTPNTDHTGLLRRPGRRAGTATPAIDLKILPYGSLAPETLMAAGQADCGISFQDSLTFAVAAGAPIRSVMAILQHTASAIAVLADSGDHPAAPARRQDVRRLRLRRTRSRP